MIFYYFFKQQPSLFKGNSGLIRGQALLEEIRNAFEVVNFSKEQNIVFVAHLLKGEAEHWWKGAKAHLITLETLLD